MSAEGRSGIALEESRLAFDPDTRWLRLHGEADRIDCEVRRLTDECCGPPDSAAPCRTPVWKP